MHLSRSRRWKEGFRTFAGRCLKGQEAQRCDQHQCLSVHVKQPTVTSQRHQSHYQSLVSFGSEAASSSPGRPISLRHPNPVPVPCIQRHTGATSSHVFELNRSKAAGCGNCAKTLNSGQRAERIRLKNERDPPSSHWVRPTDYS